MAQTKVTSGELAPNKTVDANGWTRYNFGSFSIYRKRLTFSQTISGGAVLGLSSSNLPSHLSTISNHFINYSYSATGNAYALDIILEGTSAASNINFTTSTNDGVSRAYSGFIDIELIEQ